MAFETVTGYCWPQSVDGRRHGRAAPVVGRAGGRCRSRWRGSGGERDVVFADDAVPADDHPTPHRRASDGLRLAGRAGARRRPGLALGLLRGRPRDRRRRQAPAQPRLLRRAPAGRRARPRRSCSRSPPTPGTPTTTSAAATSTPAAPTVSLQRPMSPGYLFKPPGAGRRVTTTSAARSADGGARRLPARSTTSRPTPARRAGPTGSCRSSQWAEREGYAIDVVTNADLEEHPELLGPATAGTRCSCRSATTSTGRAGMRDTVEGFIGRGRQRRVPLGQHVVLAGAPRGPDPRGPGRDDGRATRASSSTTRCTAPTASASSRASGPTTSSAGPRTT